MLNFNYTKEIKKAFKKHFFNKTFKTAKEQAITDVINLILKSPQRINGFLRFQPIRNKLIQCLAQSYEIKIGYVLEDFFTALFACKYTILDKTLISGNNKLKCDQLFEDEKYIYLVEQKIRDDHDSSKKEGQINNFKNKINSLQSKCSDKRKKLKCYFWFIDEGFVKYKSFYFNEIKKITQSFVKTKNLCYGRSIIDDLLGKDCWDNFEEAYNSVKKSFSNGFINTILKYNFDEDKKDIVFKILKNKRKKTIDKLLNNSEYTEVRNILFPNNIVLNKIKQHFDV